ncbi:hypothetical protein J6590_098235 [Homalodisca vitripennis]|nr:hypothetical protein J6590_098235 [Homalodisca vitripennis]
MCKKCSSSQICSPKTQLPVQMEINSSNSSIQELEQSIMELNPENTEDNLLAAAKIGSALLDENNFLKSQNTKLSSKLANMEAKIEELESCEEKYMFAMEKLQEKNAELESQGIREKENLLKVQKHGLKRDQIENIVITGYYLKAHFCRTEHRKGGVAIYVEKNVERHTEELIVVQFYREITLEAALIKIRLKQSVIHILGTYRSPNGDFDLALEKVSNIITSTRIVDILYPDRRSILLDETLASHNSKRVQLPATRITPTTQSSIDWICSNIDTEKLDTKVIHAGISDHTAKSCEVNFAAIQDNPLRIRIIHSE